MLRVKIVTRSHASFLISSVYQNLVCAFVLKNWNRQLEMRLSLIWSLLTIFAVRLKTIFYDGEMFNWIQKVATLLSNGQRFIVRKSFSLNKLHRVRILKGRAQIIRCCGFNKCLPGAQTRTTTNVTLTSVNTQLLSQISTLN